MLYEFRSRATGTVIMTADVAEPLLRVIGKEPGETGIVTANQLDLAIDRLEAAVREGRQPPAAGLHPPAQGPLAADAAPPGPDRDDEPPPVSFGQRAWPLIELLRTAKAAGRDVYWGV